MAFPHKFTEEERSKGRGNMTELKRLANSLRARKKCNVTCPLYPCPFVTIVNPETGKCALKDSDPGVRKNILRRAVESRSVYLESLISKVNENEVLLQRVKELKQEISENADPEKCLNLEMKLFSVLKQVIEVEMDVGKFIYGDKPILETAGEQRITIRWMTEAEAEEEREKMGLQKAPSIN